MKCLLIETQDKRKFLTQESNFSQLIEFSKVFNAQISVVQIKQGKILSLEELAQAICSPEYVKTQFEYETIENKLKEKSRLEMLKIAKKINQFIVNELSDKKCVSLKILKEKFKKYNLSNAALCNHIRRAKEQLELKGFRFEKLSAGTYKVK